MARFRRGAFPGRQPWQLFRLMRSRRGLGRLKRRFVARYARHVSEMSWFWQDSRAMHPKALQTAVWEYTARRSCREGALFAARAPRIMHGAQILPFLGAPFERFDLFRVGWGGAHGSRTALALYGAVLVFRALSPFVRSSTAVLRIRHTQLRAAPPLTRRMLLLSRPPSRETCPLPPCEVAYIPRRPTWGKRIRFASLGMSCLAVHVPFALRVRFAAGHVVDLVGISHEAGTRISVVASATRLKQRDRVICRRKHGAVMVFR